MASDFVVIVGTSGAGRSAAADVLEDLGWFVIDNLPPALIPKVADLAHGSIEELSRIVLVAGVGEFFEQLRPALEHLRETARSLRVLFLDASETTLIRRYELSRRPHPLDDVGLADAIRGERELLAPVKAIADLIIDTSDLNVHQLRDRIVSLFATDSATAEMRVSVMSFGYKHGLPVDVDFVLDCRFLPNPHWDPELRPLTGRDEAVRNAVLGQADSQSFLTSLQGIWKTVLPAFRREGKSYLTIAVGCTGGQHRSVAVTEAIGEQLRALGVDPVVSHRDVAKRLNEEPIRK